MRYERDARSRLRRRHHARDAAVDSAMRSAVPRLRGALMLRQYVPPAICHGHVTRLRAMLRAAHTRLAPRDAPRAFTPYALSRCRDAAADLMPPPRPFTRRYALRHAVALRYASSARDVVYAAC